MKKDIEHVRVSRTEMFCQHCGQRQEFTLPIYVDLFIAMAEEFLKIHRKCKKSNPATIDTNQTELFK